MMQRWSAPLCWSAAAMLISSAARAGVWGMDPVLGITADYATNPGLLEIPNTAQTDAALLIDAPATFNASDFKLSVLPSFRVGDTKSYSSVNSDYEHLSVKGEFDTDRSVLSASAGVSRDSSLYLNYLANGETGVRRDGATADLNWDRFLTERMEVDTDVNSSRVRYGSAVGATSLIDYKYTSITPTLAWNASERTKFTLAASAGQYDSLDGTTRSRNANLQLGFVRPLTEIWSLTASGGFSRALNRIDFDEQFLEFTPNGLEIVSVPVRAESSQNGAVYSVNLTRHGERLTLNAIASRQETPTGFAFLSRQNTVELQVNYSLSARWSLSGDAKYLSAQDPQRQGASIDRTVDYFGLNASWQWTEHWTLTLGASRVTERYQSPHIDLASNQVAVTLSQRFNHIGFQ
jgi:hypothetical protein